MAQQAAVLVMEEALRRLDKCRLGPATALWSEPSRGVNYSMISTLRRKVEIIL